MATDKSPPLAVQSGIIVDAIVGLALLAQPQCMCQLAVWNKSEKTLGLVCWFCKRSIEHWSRFKDWESMGNDISIFTTILISSVLLLAWH